MHAFIYLMTTPCEASSPESIDILARKWAIVVFKESVDELKGVEPGAERQNVNLFISLIPEYIETKSLEANWCSG